LYVSIRDCMLPAMGTLDPFEALAALGLRSVEVAVSRGAAVEAFSANRGKPFELTSAADRRELWGLMEAEGVSVCAFLMGNDFTSGEFHREVGALVATCEAAEATGVPAVRVDMVLGDSRMPQAEFVRRCGEAVRQALKATDMVRIGVENHGNTSNRPEILEQLFEAVGDRRFGLTLDSGNFYWYGHPLARVYEIMKKYADRVCHTHIKNIAYPAGLRNVQREMGYRYGDYVAPIYEGDVDHGKVVAILRAAGYDGDLTVEDESLGKFPAEKRAEVLKKDVEYLRSLI